MAKKKKQELEASPYQRYIEEISKYEREFKKWEGRNEKILKRYRDDGREARTNAQSRFNILWSNVQTLVPACFSRIPQPDVSRRFRDNDQVGRVASLILERALDFEIQHYTDYRTTLKQCVYDRFLGGRGTAWIRYEPHFKQGSDTGQVATGVTEDVRNESESTEQLDYECVPVDYVHWRDFGHSVARTWEEVGIVWRRVYMDRDAVADRFGDEIADQLPYDSTPDDLKKTGTKNAEENWKQQAIIYELWDKTEGKAFWLSKSYKEFCDEREDPLGLQEFFPCPRPLYATLTNETLVPVPDFTLYQDQANELDVLADRIDGLSKMLQLKGTYDSSIPELRRLFTEAENGTLIPVKNMAAFAEKGGLKGAIDIYDLKPLAEALRIAQEAMEQIKNQVYEITGIADIIRGQGEASETATAQQIKGQFASLRLKSLQDQVAYFATEILQIKAQVMCSKFAPQTIAAISAADQLEPIDKQAVPQAMALLVGPQRLQDPAQDAPNPLRSFRVEVSADSLVQMDEKQEKSDRMEMLTSFGQYLQAAAQIGAMSPPMIPLLVEVGKFGLTSFKIGKAIEGTFDTALEQLKQAAAQPKGPDPKVQAEQARAQADMQVAQMDVHVAQQKAQIDMQKMSAEQQMQHQQMQIDQAQQQQDMSFAQQQHQMKSQHAAAQHQQKMQQAMQKPAGRPQ